MDLFPTLPQTLSPRLQWMERHHIECNFDADDNDIRVRWTARSGEVSASGPTEDEALTALAKSAGIRLWNEPQD